MDVDNRQRHASHYGQVVPRSRLGTTRLDVSDDWDPFPLSTTDSTHMYTGFKAKAD